MVVLTVGTGYVVTQEFAYVARVTPREELTSVHNREQLTHPVAESERLGLLARLLLAQSA